MKIYHIFASKYNSCLNKPLGADGSEMENLIASEKALGKSFNNH